jgi:hypothetical protein
VTFSNTDDWENYMESMRGLPNEAEDEHVTVLGDRLDDGHARDLALTMIYAALRGKEMTGWPKRAAVSLCNSSLPALDPDKVRAFIQADVEPVGLPEEQPDGTWLIRVRPAVRSSSSV